MLFLYFLQSIYAIAFWITGLLIGFLLAQITVIDIRNMCILFGGIGVLMGTIMGKMAIKRQFDIN
ncbi:MAG: hypothetical protein ACXVH2_06930 [Methanobacterium sp.]